MSAAVISCSVAREFVNRPPEKTRKFNDSVPSDMETAVRDYKMHDPSAFKIILPGPGQILLGDPESQPIDLNTLGQKVEEFSAAKSPYDRVVYLGVSVDVPYTEVIAVLDELRKRNIDNVKLMTSRRKSSDEDGSLPSNTSGPDSVLEVKLQNPLLVLDRPNPLTLVVKIGADGKATLNKEPQIDPDALSTKLTEIFKSREMNGVFREGTNEIEKTVLIADNNSNTKYGQIVKLVDIAKLGGASPVVLTDEEMNFPVGDVTDLKRPLQAPARPSQNDPPKIISGGVLNGKATSLPKPPYPAAARAVRASGAVTVQVIVDLDGKVIEANAVSGHTLLRPAAVAAARSAKFAPTMLSGKPVKVSGVITYNFVP